MRLWAAPQGEPLGRLRHPLPKLPDLLHVLPLSQHSAQVAAGDVDDLLEAFVADVAHAQFDQARLHFFVVAVRQVPQRNWRKEIFFSKFSAQLRPCRRWSPAPVCRLQPDIFAYRSAPPCRRRWHRRRSAGILRCPRYCNNKRPLRREKSLHSGLFCLGYAMAARTAV